MNEFELFSLIYYALDAYYGRDIKNTYINNVVRICLFLMILDLQILLYTKSIKGLSEEKRSHWRTVWVSPGNI